MLTQGHLGGWEALQITLVCRCCVTRAVPRVAAGQGLEYPHPQTATAGFVKDPHIRIKTISQAMPFSRS